MIKRAALCIVLMLAFASIAHACPMCKDSVPNSDAQQASSVPVGLNYSVYVILIGFLSVLGTTLAMIVKSIRTTDGIQRAGFPVIDPRRRPPTSRE